MYDKMALALYLYKGKTAKEIINLNNTSLCIDSDWQTNKIKTL